MPPFSEVSGELPAMNDANLETPKPKRGRLREVAGRKESGGQEKIIKSEVVKEKITELMELKNKAKQSREAFSAAVKAVAKESGYMTSVVRALVDARADNDFKDAQRKYDQLSLIFSDVGE